jgi:carbon-monoxide dehydrogenase medium subunit
MKPVAFDLEMVRSIEEALDLLDTSDREVRVLAGGQSLVPLLNLRLARPSLLVDVNRVQALDFVQPADSGLTIGAMTRLRTLECSPDVARLAPLVKAALPWIAHEPIRNRSTLGGTLAHADNAAELCAVALALDAVVIVRGTGGQREIPIGELFLGPFTTSLAANELVTEIRLPRLSPSAGWAFDEVARRRGDFALVGIAAVLDVGTGGEIVEARLAYASMGPRPLRARHVEDWLRGRAAHPDTFAEAADMALAELDPQADLHASREYRRRVARALTRRALATAARPPRSGT